VLGNAVEDMQVGCLWQGDFLISVSLSGFINYLDKSSGRLSRVVKVCGILINSVNVSAVLNLFCWFIDCHCEQSVLA